MKRLDRHDHILMERRRRQRKVVNHVRPFFWLGQGCLAIFMTLFVILLAVVGISFAAVMGIYRTYAAQLPDASAIEYEQEEFQTVRIYDSTGTVLLYESVDAQRGDRIYMSIDRMSPWVWKSAVALEDRNFFENTGINVRGLLRAFVSNLGGGSVQGGSSITQQLVKNVIIPPEERFQQSYARKIKEVILATEVTRQYPKNKILEWYLNNNSYGGLANGIEAASQIYFGKSSSELTLAEAAMLAPIPNFPALNPINDPESAKSRQQIALQAMVETGMITQAEADAAFAETLETRTSYVERFDNLTAPHFALYVLDKIKQEYNTTDDPYFIWRNGLTIYTTLDVGLQKYAEQVAREQVVKLIEDGKNAHNASVVAIKNGTGEILAMVGSIDYNNEEIDGQVNVAISERQPGSSFKPYVYLTALQKDMTPATMIMDVATAFPQADGTYYRPENYDRQYHGPVSLRNAMARSYNIPAIRVMSQVGVADALRTAHRMGINGLSNSLSYYRLNLVLGGGEVTLLDHTFAYSVFGNQGIMIGEPTPPDELKPGYRSLEPVSILKVVDSTGNVLKDYAESKPQTERIFSSEVAYLMADMMSDDVARAPAFGSNTDLTLPDRKVAAKTGTTNGFKDNWTMGFAPQVTVGVWVGNTDNESMQNVTGLSGAAPIWHAVMSKYLEDKPAIWYDQPPGITTRAICQPSGLLPTEYCPGDRQRYELFVAGTEPTLADNIWQPFEIDSETGKLASPSTPPERREVRVYEILPQEAADWVRENGITQPPTEQSGLLASDVDPDVAIIFPPPQGYVKDVVEIRGNARGGSYRVEFGPGDDPQSWQQIGPEHGEEVSNGVLERLDTNPLEEGRYTLRLFVNRDGGREYRTSFTVDRTPPTAVLSEPKPDQLYVMEDDEQININVLPSDRWNIDRVVFFVDGSPFVTTTVAPYNEAWKIKMQDVGQIEAPETDNWLGFESDDPDVQPGRLRPLGEGGFAAIRTSAGVYFERHRIKAEVFDGAGNKTETTEVTVYVRHKKAEN
ncbi:MAG: transglycosylase domain-containing protein [Caldilineaceae bacterium]|nr:transglycosylase domain-containing protein [Caldilineaceae bacterium]